MAGDENNEEHLESNPKISNKNIENEPIINFSQAQLKRFIVINRPPPDPLFRPPESREEGNSTDSTNNTKVDEGSSNNE